MDESFLKLAIEQSRVSVRQNAFPVGAIIIIGGEIVSKSISNGKQLRDPTSHAETAAIRDACSRIESRDLKEATLYSSMEPCLMCYSACYWASIRKLVYACSRARLSPMHFEGQHDLAAINDQARKPIELIHMEELEDEAMQVVQNWEATLQARTK